jgi:hypothetical protein
MVGNTDDMADTCRCSLKLGAYFSLDHLASSRKCLDNDLI